MFDKDGNGIIDNDELVRAGEMYEGIIPKSFVHLINLNSNP